MTVKAVWLTKVKIRLSGRRAGRLRRKGGDGEGGGELALIEDGRD